MAPMKTEVLPIQTPEQFEVAVARAVELLRAGEIVALPTETVYGLAANAWDAEAVAKIFAAKKRPAHNPIIVHVASLGLARRCVAAWSACAGKLARAFWPGPLTLVLPKSKAIPDIVTAGGPTVGVRWPDHPFIQAVIRRCRFPLAAPSANPAGRISPTTAQHVLAHLANKVPLVIDGGPTTVGIESTVVDLTVTPWRVLRPGMIHEDAIAAVIGHGHGPKPGQRIGVATSPVGPLARPRSPGLLKRHYSPRAKLVVLSWRNDAELKSKIRNLKVNPACCHVIAHSSVPGRSGFGGVSVMPREPAAYARALYAELHRCDAAGAGLIVVEAVPATVEWRGVADRLCRASA